MSKFKMVMILFIVSLLILGVKFGYSESSYISTINDNGILHEYKNDYVLDKDEKYKVGQHYKVTHKFYFHKLIGRDIELDE